jgi:hypothetical protein
MRKLFPLLSILATTACAPAGNEDSQSMEMPDEAAIVSALDAGLELFLSSWDAGDVTLSLLVTRKMQSVSLRHSPNRFTDRVLSALILRPYLLQMVPVIKLPKLQSG